VRNLGALPLVVPLATAAVFAGLAGLMGAGGAESRSLAKLLLAGLEVGLPLAAGLIAAGVVAGEPAVELHCSLPTRYRTTLGRRLALLLGWTSLVCVGCAALLAQVDRWIVPRPFAVGQLGWLAPLLWFVAAGAALALALRSRAASRGVLVGVWLAVNLFRETFLGSDLLRPWFLFATTYTPGAGADHWPGNRATIVATAVAVAIGAWAMLRTGEAPVGGGGA
jgi:hypothetical protein